MFSFRQIPFAAGVFAWLAVTLTGAFYLSWRGQGGRPLAIVLGVFAFFLAAELLPAARGVTERLASFARGRRAALYALLPFAAYLIYALGTNTFLWTRSGLVAGYIALPIALTASCADAASGRWQDYAAMLAITLPVKFRAALHYIWPYHDEQLAHTLAILLAVSVTIISFLLIRRLNRVGYSIGWGRGCTRQIIFSFALVAAIDIPLGMRIGFIRYAPQWSQWKTLPLIALAILLFTAWPEELLFRGILQNCLTRTLRSQNVAWLVASVIFGFTHITNYHFPNWKYVLLATIAGLFYARAWRKTGSLFPAALVHMLVDATWHFLFRTI